MSESNSNRAIVFLAFGLLVAGGVFAFVYFRTPHAQPPEEPITADVMPPDAGETEPATVEPPVAEPAPLPPLEKPDDEKIRELAGELSANQEYARWLDNQYMLGKFVAVVENLSNGKVPRNLIIFLEPEGEFSVFERGGKVFLDPKSYHRYDHLAKAFASIDAGKCARLIARMSPWLENKYREIGKPDQDFKGALALAFTELLRVPIVLEDIPLAPDPVMYKISIEELEAMSDAQKQLFRMGPDNIRKIQAKLREIGRALGMGKILAEVQPVSYPVD